MNRLKVRHNSAKNQYFISILSVLVEQILYVKGTTANLILAIFNSIQNSDDEIKNLFYMGIYYNATGNKPCK